MRRPKPLVPPVMTRILRDGPLAAEEDMMLWLQDAGTGRVTCSRFKMGMLV